MRMQRTPSLIDPTEESFLRRYEDRIWPEPNSGCWLWVGGVNAHGYAVTTPHLGTKSVHRITFLLRRGRIPKGLQLDHLCRVRCCVNPDHLEPVTSLENTRRGVVGINNRVKTHCPKGHPLSGDNLYVGKNGRVCKTCRRDGQNSNENKQVRALNRARKRLAIRALSPSSPGGEP